jgi:hypothetical protein
VGVTASGLLLLRIVGPDYETDAAKQLPGALDRCRHSTARPLGRLADFRNRRRSHGHLNKNTQAA